MPGKLYLIPSPVAESVATVVPPSTVQQIAHLRYFLAEDVRTARRYLSSLKIYPSIEELHFNVLNKDTTVTSLPDLLSPLTQHDMGVVSEAGCPGVADPGALAVQYAHQHQIKVIPLVGPSSLLLALMASGLNGQQFAFHGYLPVEAKQLSRAIKDLERESSHKQQTQIVIETPYRNNSLFSNLLQALHETTQLTVARNLTAPDEVVLTKTIKAWRQAKPTWPKSPAVFLFLAALSK